MCKVVLSNSSAASFSSCRRQYDYKVNKGICPSENAKCYDNAAALSEAITTISSSYAAKSDPELAVLRATDVIRSRIQDDMDCARLEAAVRAYVKRYYDLSKQGCWEVIPETVNATVDVSVSPNVIYKAHICYAIRHVSDGKIVVVVNKSSNSVGEDFACRYFIDNDVRMQVLAVRQLVGEAQSHNVVGVIINALSRPQHKIKVGETDAEYAERNAARKGKADLKRKVGETREEFVTRMVEDYPMESLQRTVILFSDAQLEHAVSNVTAMAGDIMACKQFYPNTTECTKNGKCPYMSLCMADGDLSKVEGQYVMRDQK